MLENLSFLKCPALLLVAGNLDELNLFDYLHTVPFRFSDGCRNKGGILPIMGFIRN